MISICSVCARGGSKGVPNKNLVPINGIPLIAYSLIQAKKANLFDVIACSSDSADILGVAKEFGAEILVKRPNDMALDTSPKIPVIRHCMLSVEESLGVKTDFMVDLDATAPVRDPRHIQEVYELVQQSTVSNIITGVPSRKSPYFNLVELVSDGSSTYPTLSKSCSKEITRRQDAPRCFDMNASIYAWRRESLLSMDSLFGVGTRLYEMPEVTAFDVDTEIDLEIVKTLMDKYAFN